MMTITCYGPRGSLPAPSRRDFPTVEYGGNTSCYYVEAGPFRIILDNGSGSLVLGNDIMKKLLIPQKQKTGSMGLSFINLISHYHWDHVQGLPFCVPYYIAGNTFHIHGFTASGYEDNSLLRTSVEMLLAEQQKNPHFPVAHECLPAHKEYTSHPRQFSEAFYYLAIHGEYHHVHSLSEESLASLTTIVDIVKITTIPLNHPDGCLGYRIDYMGNSFVYCTDTEPMRHSNHAINTHAKDCDLILLDGQYTETQLGSTAQTFGHGTPLSCVEQAIACRAKHVIVHHHDPNHDDHKLAAMEAELLHVGPQLLGYSEVAPKIEFCREGQVWVLGG